MRNLLRVVLAVAFSITACSASAQSSTSREPGAGTTSGAMDSKIAAFTKEVLSIVGPGSVSVAFTNSSSLPEQQFLALRDKIDRQLRSAPGVSIRTDGQVSSEIRVIVSQNIRGPLLIGEVLQGQTRTVAMKQLVGVAVETSTSETLKLAARFIASDTDPILDVGFTGDAVSGNTNALVLTSTSLDFYVPMNTRLQRTARSPLQLSSVLPRDPRGRVLLSGSTVEAYLPGAYCSAEVQNSGPTAAACHASDDPFPLGSQRAVFSSSKNFFTGVLLPGIGAQPPAFFSAASLLRGSSQQWLFAAVDGRLMASNATGTTTRLAPLQAQVGSDIAALQTGCGSGWQVLASAPGESGVDSLTAYEVTERGLSVASTSMSFSGAVTSLWPTSDGRAAIAVIHNSKTESYDAYLVTVSCSR